MNNEIKKVLFKLEKSGFEAYVVGGYVRDYLLGIESFDVDICTNALPKDIIKVFKIKKGVNNYGSIPLKIGKYNYDITTYRMDGEYINHKPKSIIYVDNLLVDLKRRDFTINALCMNREGKVFDYLDGTKDIQNKIIKTIGDANKRLSEDPVRILRAIRFAIVLNFELDNDILEYIKNNKEILKDISYTRKKQELEKIFSSKNLGKGLEYLKELDLLDELDIKYDKIVEVSDVLGIWAQIDFDLKYPFTKQSLTMIKQIRIVVNNVRVDNLSLLKYGLYVCLVAGEILGFSKEEINKMDKQMPIHKLSDLKITNDDIMSLLDMDGSPKLRKIYDDVLLNVLNGKLKNNKKIIKKYIIKNWM